jgi:hypothetical protein
LVFIVKVTGGAPHPYKAEADGRNQGRGKHPDAIHERHLLPFQLVSKQAIIG